MHPYGLNELREMFLNFFESKGHLRLNSFSLIPHNDKSLLLINSGMAPLKPYFTGQETPPRKRVTTCQKCIRTPDIENVGKTARHGTFFEMLGNFSFGDYFKHESIRWGWEFLTEVVKIPVDLLYVTVYEDDDEAFAIWRDEIGVEERRIVRMGKEDNFWEIGTGPCGPCSEIYVDRGEQYGCGKEGCYVGCDCDRYVEVWNHVFTQFDKDDNGVYNRLANPNIDTGMGLERLAVVMQGVGSLFEVDTVRHVLDYVCELAGIKYKEDEKNDVSIRVITDHIRSTVFMLSDGVMPSNEGRGYVLRRLLRRAIRHGKILGINGKFMLPLAEKVIETSKQAYPNMVENYDAIMKILDVEENKFNETITSGMNLIKELIDSQKAKGENTISGDDAFKLYDTYGFPLELTLEIAEEEGMSVDTDRYAVVMQEQKLRAKAAHAKQGIEGWKDELTEIVSEFPATKFVGYDNLVYEAEVICIVNGGARVNEVEEGAECVIFTAETPFYAQSGGQVGDTGVIVSDTFSAQVTDTQKSGDKHAHYVTVIGGTLKEGDKVTLKVDAKRRTSIARNHTSTHLLHKALRIVLGNHVNQAGSEVSPDRLRFDFSHFEKMTAEEIKKVEDLVNEAILDCIPVDIINTTMSEAKALGATALFGEKYADDVRVVKAGDFSMELCGGCHLQNTGFAGLFKIVSEAGVAAGVRRIEAVTGMKAYEYAQNNDTLLKEAAAVAKTNIAGVAGRINDLNATVSSLNKQLNEVKKAQSANVADDLLAKVVEVNGTKTLVEYVEGLDMNELRDLCDKLRDKMNSGVVMIISVKDEKGSIIAAATKDVVANGFNAGKFVKEVAVSVGSGGGGRADMAQAGLKDITLAGKAAENAKEIIKNML
ncbi:MAG: alanine--tRNA ligase [Anaerofustis stercorihominis]|nr:alanine--tRNA ligase [Anaerofustis stercorihominis]